MLFDTAAIKNGPDRGLRIALAVTAVVPLLFIFIAGAVWRMSATATSGTNNVQGQPPSWFFAFFWTLITLMWGLVVVLAALQMIGRGALVAVLVLSVLLAIVCALWLYVYNGLKQKGNSCLVLGTALLLGLVMWSVLATATYSDNDARIACTAMFAVFVAWAAYALMLNFFDANLKA